MECIVSRAPDVIGESWKFLMEIKPQPAESLGDVETLVNHPATMTHASIPADIRLKRGVDDGLIRLSVGIEDVADLQDDLEKALAAV